MNTAKATQIRVSDQTRKLLKKVAADTGETMTDAADRILRDALVKILTSRGISAH